MSYPDRNEAILSQCQSCMTDSSSLILLINVNEINDRAEKLDPFAQFNSYKGETSGFAEQAAGIQVNGPIISFLGGIRKAAGRIFYRGIILLSVRRGSYYRLPFLATIDITRKAKTVADTRLFLLNRTGPPFGPVRKRKVERKRELLSVQGENQAESWKKL